MDWVDKAKSVAEILSAAWRWVALAGVVLALLMLARACNRADRAEGEVERLEEVAKLERAGFLVAGREKEKVLKAAVAQVPALQAEIDRLASELRRKPKIVTVERIVTAPSPAEGSPRPSPIPGEPCPACMFASGDTGQIRVDSAHVETAEGNEVVALSAECWRLTPEPASRILSGTASAPLSRVSVTTPPSTPGWGAGIAGGLATTGLVGSGVIVSPPFWRLEGVAVLSAGSDLFAAQVGLVYRP